ncbi:aldehyde dehydrogenase family protein [Patulibacter minatonensis]|uniref:aldehyde dehydrogenase family protein n=1 Tax=Patulibacter minatonensis TaxID=298163 RepID=UPI0004AC8511|nr:aldehyde dehydrogenase family protein [Patulibacter minatonensis]
MAGQASTASTTAVPGTAESIEVRRPADGTVIGNVPVHTAADVAAMAAQLREAQVEWEAIGPHGRRLWLQRLRDWMLDNEDRLTELVVAESGKVHQDASVEVPTCVDIINYYAEHAEAFMADRRERPHSPAYLTKQLKVVHRPHPLVGVITAWNFPLVSPLIDVPPALAAGCAVLSKPSEAAPLAWGEVVRGWREDLAAPPVLACATGFGETGAAVVDAVDMVQFTGSAATGRRIGIRCAERMIPAGLELGGKDAMIVLADADLERAANGAVWGGFFNAGQVCVSVERVFVEAPVYDAFVEKVVEKTRALRQGPERGPFGADVGALVTDAQLQIVARHVDDALARGAKAPVGGGRRPGQYFEPTVLTDVTADMECMTEETFGPTLPVMKVADADEAVRLANASEYGLSAAVYSKDHARAEAVGRRLEVGTVNINNSAINVFQLSVPMGGWKNSGLGARSGGADGLLKYCRSQTITVDRFEPASELIWFPYTQTKGRIFSTVSRLIGGRDLRRRFGMRPR